MSRTEDRTLATTSCALVTGAASGIGRAFAQALAKRGHHLILLDRDEELRVLARDLAEAHQKIRVESILVDLTDPDAGTTILRHCHRRRLRVSMLINNAGVGSHASFATQTRATMQRIVDVNIAAATEIVRLFLPHMLRKKNGTIINVSSIAAFEPEPGTAVYAASKAYLQSFTEALAAEVRDSGVYVASVCPGITITPFLAAAGLDPSTLQSPAQTPEQVVEEALAGMSRRQELIVTGFSNRLRITAHRLSIRRVIHFLRQGLRRISGR